MNKLIKKLMEGLFDDFDDETFTNDSDVSQLIIAGEDKPKIKEWLLDHILCMYGTPFKAEEGKDIEFFMKDGELYCDIKINSQSTTFTDEIPDYVKINKIDCGTVIFNYLTNLPREIDGTLHIYKSKLKDFSGIRFPEKVGELNLIDCKLRSLTGLNDYCKHIDLLNLEGCNMFTSFNGIPEEVESMKLLKCKKIVDLQGIPETVNYLSLVSLLSLETLNGCPNKLQNGLYILDCKYLTSLVGSPSLIIGDCEIRDSTIYLLDMQNTRITGSFKLIDVDLVDLENGPKQIDGSYIVTDKYLKYFKASGTKMTNAYNNAEFIYQVSKKTFKGITNNIRYDKTDYLLKGITKDMPLMSDGVEVIGQYLEDLY